MELSKQTRVDILNILFEDPDFRNECKAWVKFSLTLLDFLRLPETDSERQI
jgi:hypothetical protein